MSTLLDIFSAIKKHNILVNEKLMAPCPSSEPHGYTANSPIGTEFPIGGNNSSNTFKNNISTSNNTINAIQQQQQQQMSINSNKKVSIRFILFYENSDATRSIIFDSAKYTSTNTSSASQTVQQTQRKTQNASFNKSQSIPLDAPQKKNTKTAAYSPSSNKLNNDTLTKMVFGSFPMIVSNRNAIKVHSLR